MQEYHNCPCIHTLQIPFYVFLANSNCNCERWGLALAQVLFIIIMNKSQKNDFFSRVPEIDFRYEMKARKVTVDFKFDALYS